MTGSVEFDRAAEFYDQSRSISDEAMARTMVLLVGELIGRGRVLEVGVGTGLVALRLHDAGVPVAGLDLSALMLAKLVDKANGRVPFPLARADATRMPFADASFGGAYLRWVLHLIPAWRGALGEMVRVVRPGGVVLVNLGAYGGPREEIQSRFAEIAGISIQPVGLGWDDVEPLDDAMVSLGAQLRILPAVREERDESLEEFLQGIEQNLYSWTWPLPEDVRRRAVAELRPWAADRFGPPDAVHRQEFSTVWRAYDLP